MTVIMYILIVVFLALLIIVTAMIPVRPSLSPFELKRRSNDKTEGSEHEAKRAAYYAGAVTVQRTLSALLLVIVTALLVAQFGWVFGVLLAVAVALGHGRVSRNSYVALRAQAWYIRLEPKLFEYIARYPRVTKWLKWAAQDTGDTTIGSKEELSDLVARSTGVVSNAERDMILGGLMFGDRFVSEIMTPKAVIETIKKGEVMGPLTLDELHKTGHSRFPVVDGDIDHVIGMLYIRDVLTIDTTKKTTSKVESVMDTKVFFIHEDQTLREALPAFLSTHHHLFIVINQYRETVGLLSLEDVIEALLGRPIVDEYDTHDDLRSVAERVSKRNNRTESSKDI